MRAWAATAGVGVLLAVLLACATTIPGRSPDNYPLPNGTPTDHYTVAGPVDQPATAPVLTIRVRAGDRIEVLSATAIGLVTDADVSFFTARPDEQLEPLVGAVLTNTADGGERQITVVAQITPRAPSRIELTGVRISYRLNDGIAEQRTGLSASFTVCGGAATCPPP